MYRSALRSTTSQLTAAVRPATVRGFAAHATPQPFDWQDPLNAASLLTEEELAISETAEAYCQERMLPRVLGMLRSKTRSTLADLFHARGIPKREL
jgi:glutaryl-CoA dehydrogenase